MPRELNGLLVWAGTLEEGQCLWVLIPGRPCAGAVFPFVHAGNNLDVDGADDLCQKLLGGGCLVPLEISLHVELLQGRLGFSFSECVRDRAELQDTLDLHFDQSELLLTG